MDKMGNRNRHVKRLSYLGYWESRGYPNDATVGDPNDTRQNNDNLPVAEAIVVSVAGIIIATAIYITLMKTNTRTKRAGFVRDGLGGPRQAKGWLHFCVA